jgi:hypothetical protein
VNRSKPGVLFPQLIIYLLYKTIGKFGPILAGSGKNEITLAWE